MRPVSSRLVLALAGFAGLTLAGADVSAASGGGHAGVGHSRAGHVSAHVRGWHRGVRGAPTRTAGRGYGAGDFGRASLGRGYGSGDRFVYGPHGRFGHLGLGYGVGGYESYGRGSAYDRFPLDAPSCCVSNAVPTASGIRAAPVAPPAIYVIGGLGRHGHLRRPARGETLEAASAMASYPSGVVSSGGARIIRVP